MNIRLEWTVMSLGVWKSFPTFSFSFFFLCSVAWRWFLALVVGSLVFYSSWVTNRSKQSRPSLPNKAVFYTCLKAALSLWPAFCFLSLLPTNILQVIFNNHFLFVSRLLDVLMQESRLYLIFEFLSMDLKKYLDSIPSGQYMEPMLVKVTALWNAMIRRDICAIVFPTFFV